MSRWRQSARVGGLCLLWYAASACSNVCGKLALNELPLPLTLSAAQLLAVALLTPLATRLARVRSTPLPASYYLRVLVPLAFAKFLTTMLSQISIWKVPVSYAHTVKATTPLWTCMLGWAALGARPTARVFASLLMITAGVALASATEQGFHAGGLSAALAAAALLAAQHLAAKHVMKTTGLHHLRLLQLLGQLALMQFTPVWLLHDGADLMDASPAAGWPRVLILLTADALLAWLQAVLAFSILSLVSPLTYAVASAAKRAVVVFASLLVLRNPAPAANLAGMALAAAGVLAYNRAKLPAQGQARPLLPV